MVEPKDKRRKLGESGQCSDLGVGNREKDHGLGVLKSRPLRGTLGPSSSDKEHSLGGQKSLPPRGSQKSSSRHSAKDTARSNLQRPGNLKGHLCEWCHREEYY